MSAKILEIEIRLLLTMFTEGGGILLRASVLRVELLSSAQTL
jgi:hypothetical protein